jgi:hypothetical protein
MAFESDFGDRRGARLVSRFMFRLNLIMPLYIQVELDNTSHFSKVIFEGLVA